MVNEFGIGVAGFDWLAALDWDSAEATVLVEAEAVMAPEINAWTGEKIISVQHVWNTTTLNLQSKHISLKKSIGQLYKHKFYRLLTNRKNGTLPTILLTVLGRPFGFLGAPDTAAVLGLLTVVGLTRAVTALIG